MTSTDPVRTSKAADIATMMRHGDLAGGLRLINEDFNGGFTPAQMDEFIAELDTTKGDDGYTLPLIFTAGVEPYESPDDPTTFENFGWVEYSSDLRNTTPAWIFAHAGFTLVIRDDTGTDWQDTDTCGVIAALRLIRNGSLRAAEPAYEFERFSRLGMKVRDRTEDVIGLLPVRPGMLWLALKDDQVVIAPFTALCLEGDYNYDFPDEIGSYESTFERTADGVVLRHFKPTVDLPTWLTSTGDEHYEDEFVCDHGQGAPDYDDTHYVDLLLKPDGSIELLG